jgi:flagellar basal body-associated protein FliL
MVVRKADETSPIPDKDKNETTKESEGKDKISGVLMIAIIIPVVVVLVVAIILTCVLVVKNKKRPTDDSGMNNFIN